MLKPSNLKYFLQHTNIYEVNLRQYTVEGTINAFIGHLPRLKDMGVEVLWFMPVHPIGKLNRKGSLGSYYSVEDYEDVNPEYGTKADFKRMVDAIHKAGMKIIIDWVANHAAWDNKWTQTNPDYFVRDINGNFMAPYDWSDVIQIDHQSLPQQEAMVKAMAYWINEFDIDGFRADLAHLTPLRFWLKAREYMNSIKEDLIWLAETEELDYYEAFDIIYAWKWMQATEGMIKKSSSFHSLQDLLTEQSTSNSLKLFFTSNHDENSWNGTEYEKYNQYAKVLAVFNYVYPNAVPLLYSAQELPNLKRLVFFEKDAIQWNQKIALHDFYKTLNALHKQIDNSAEIKFDITSTNMFCFTRKLLNVKYLHIFLNFSGDMILLDLTHLSDIVTDIFSGENLSTETRVSIASGDFLLIESE